MGYMEVKADERTKRLVGEIQAHARAHIVPILN